MSKSYCIIPIFVPHVGCPHDCIFCNQKKITGIEKEITGIEVRRTIDEYLGTMDRENTYIELSFFGGSFTGIPLDYQTELLIEAKTALDSGKIDNIRLSTRPDYINSLILDNLKRYGVGVIELGVQSMDREVLDIAERGHSPEEVIKSSGLIKDYGIKLGLQMMVGLPGDTLDKDVYTAKEIIKLNPDFVRIYPALVIRNTYMEYMYRQGLYRPLEVEEAVEVCKVLYGLFERSGIPIIRMGLQATEQINTGGDVVAGPFHPAFRELVEASLMNDMLGKLLSDFDDSDEINVSVNPLDISKLYADKKKIFYDKIRLHSTKRITIKQSKELNRGTLVLDNGKITRKMSINQYVNTPE